MPEMIQNTDKALIQEGPFSLSNSFWYANLMSIHWTKNEQQKYQQYSIHHSQNLLISINSPSCGLNPQCNYMDFQLLCTAADSPIQLYKCLSEKTNLSNVFKTIHIVYFVPLRTLFNTYRNLHCFCFPLLHLFCTSSFNTPRNLQFFFLLATTSCSHTVNSHREVASLPPCCAPFKSHSCYKSLHLTYPNHIEICIVLPFHHYISFAPSSSIPIEISIVVFCFRHCIPQLHNKLLDTQRQTERERERERDPHLPILNFAATLWTKLPPDLT